jgi:hypothetical protein
MRRPEMKAIFPIYKCEIIIQRRSENDNKK